MRIIKLGPSEFPTRPDVEEFFETELRKSDRNGKFIIPNGWIAESALDPGVRLIFSFRGTILYLAEAATGRKTNEDDYADQYPYYFNLVISSIRRTDVSL